MVLGELSGHALSSHLHSPFSKQSLPDPLARRTVVNLMDKPDAYFCIGKMPSGFGEPMVDIINGWPVFLSS